MSTLFIDGSHGTVGMALQPYLVALQEDGWFSEVIRLEGPQAKDPAARADAMRAADTIVFCLPDDVAPQAVRLAKHVNPKARLLDTSAAFRCNPDWLYGLPEAQEAGYAGLTPCPQYIANPGCLATGCILLARPLASLLATDGGGRPWLPFQAVTGYSASGHRGRPGPFRMAQLGRPHRHLPEIEKYAGVSPVLTTAVGDWERGMMVQATVPLREAEVLAAYQDAYEQHPFIHVQRAMQHPALTAEQHNGTVEVTLSIAGHRNGGTTVVAVYDNLGKGSAGAAAANLCFLLS